jgi:hypothetical protein
MAGEMAAQHGMRGAAMREIPGFCRVENHLKQLRIPAKARPA